jgi:hypothetical protein
MLCYKPQALLNRSFDKTQKESNLTAHRSDLCLSAQIMSDKVSSANMIDRVGLPYPQVPPHFKVWKLEQDSPKPRKHKNHKTTIAQDESLPDHDWYCLEHEIIQRDIERMCFQLTTLVEKYYDASPEIAGLAKSLRTGYIIPRANGTQALERVR